MNRHQLDRRRSIASDLPTIPAAPLSGRSIVVKVVNDGAIPTTVPKYFACVPVTPSGVETEGGTRTLTDGSGRVYVCVLGPHVPMAGEYLVASEVGGRWAACWPDQGGVGVCGFTFPRTWTYTGSHTIAYGVVWYYPSFALIAANEDPFTMTYGNRPAALPASIEQVDIIGNYTSYTLPDVSWWSGPVDAELNSNPGYEVYTWGFVFNCNLYVVPIVVAPGGPHQYFYHDRSPLAAQLTVAPNDSDPFHAEVWINSLTQQVPGAGGAHEIEVNATHAGDDVVDASGSAGAPAALP